MEKRFTVYILLAGLLLASCGGRKPNGAENHIEESRQVAGEAYVDTMRLRMSQFNKQIVCNGRLRAKAKSNLAFASQGITMKIYVKEGQWVPKGALIAALDQKERIREVEKAEHDLARAKVELTDKLISMGYGADMKDLPVEIRQRAEVVSGYYTAKYQLQTAKTALAECSLHAPFSGRVANLEARAHQRNEQVCTLIDDSQFEVEFKVLEAELGSIKKGQKVKVSPFISSADSYEGIVTGINPQVDDKGLVKVTARMDNKGKALMDGMNVRIIVEQRMGNMFVVPKDAVVERDGYHVMFLYRDGRAVWTYVDIVHSNINSFAVTGCKRKETTLSEGDIVITSGNLNLADDTEVKLQ